MSNDVLRWVIALAVFAHGVGHILFMPFLSGTLRLQASGHSWLLSGIVGDGLTKALAGMIAVVALAAFVAGAGGVLTQATWWRPLLVAGALISLALVVGMWDGLPTSSAFFALAFDVVVLVALVIAHWPSTEAIGR